MPAKLTKRAEEVATLRALLLTWDETRPPQIGDALSVPVRLPAGRLVNVITAEVLALRDQQNEEI